MKIVEEGFLELINNILMIGVIPALFGDDEKDAIINACRNASGEAGYGVGKYVFIIILVVFLIYGFSKAILWN